MPAPKGSSKNRSKAKPDGRRGEVYAPKEVADQALNRYILDLEDASAQLEKVTLMLRNLTDRMQLIVTGQADVDEVEQDFRLGVLAKQVDVAKKLWGVHDSRRKGAETRLGIMQARVRHTEAARKARAEAAVDPIEKLKQTL